MAQIETEIRTGTKPERIDSTSALLYRTAKKAVDNLYLPKGKQAVFVRLSADFFPQYRHAAMKAEGISPEDWEQALDKAKHNPLLDITYRTLVKNLTEKRVIHPSPEQEKQLKLRTRERFRKAAFRELCTLYMEANPNMPINLSKAGKLLGCARERTFQLYHSLKKDESLILPPVGTRLTTSPTITS